ncbi:MAG: FtsH protease activity modulator HflK [Desulfobacula sp.]|nr:FtsH protease activity modulator HflK [Desulfobacula sp.]
MSRKEKALLITICANFLLIALKFILAGMSGSLALKAGAWHSFSDIFVSGMVLTGLFLSRQEDLSLSKGISRIENFVSILVSFFILYIGYEIFTEVIKGEQRVLSQVPIVIAGAVLTIIISYFMARYKLYVGKETNSPSLIADGYHSMMDMYSSVIVVVGLTGYLVGLRNMDKLAAVVIVILIVLAAIEIFTNSFKALRKGGLPNTAHQNLPLETMGRYIRKIRTFGLPLLIVIYFASGIYFVQWDQVGIEKRFGKPIDIQVPPGIHYRLPWPIAQVDLVNIANIEAIETSPVLMLTGDENLVEVNTSAHYTIKNAINFAYRIKNPNELVRYAVESAVRQSVSQASVDSLLTTGKSDIIAQTWKLTQEILDRALSGIRLVNVQLLQAIPPQEVINAFQEVASAREDRATYLNEAIAYQNEIVPLSRGKAAEMIAQAIGYREKKINYATGEAQNFLDRLGEYEKATDVTRTRMYIEKMEKILANTDKLILDSQIKVGSSDLWFVKGKGAGKILREIK